MTGALLQRCDVCFKPNRKIQRRYKEKGYCITCYQFLFTKKPCKVCNELYRFHDDDKDCICLTCRRKQPCIRCGKDAFRNGSNTTYGRVCQPCNANYFKNKKVCFECGELKAGVTTFTNIGHRQAICSKCYAHHKNGTCAYCLRNRKLIESDKGKICQKCHDFGQVLCPKCNDMMWAGEGKRCHNCYWSDKLAHQVKLNQYIFRHNTIKQGYEEFTQWHAHKRSNAVASIKINNYVDFFSKCDELWGYFPSYETLVIEFKPEGLRYVTNVLRWLIDSKRIIINEELKTQIAEEERIINLFEKLSEDLPSIIKNYHQYLINRQLIRKTALKTIRLALQPVVDIYYQFNIRDDLIPSQEQIDVYLLQRPGQKNCLSSFIVFLRETQNKNLYINLNPEIKKDKLDILLKKSEIEKIMIKLMNRSTPYTEDDQLQWIYLSMYFFHDIVLLKNKTPKYDIKVDTTSEMQEIHYQDRTFLIPLLIN